MNGMRTVCEVRWEWRQNEHEELSCFGYLYWEEIYDSCLMNLLSWFSFLKIASKLKNISTFSSIFCAANVVLANVQPKKKGKRSRKTERKSHWKNSRNCYKKVKMFLFNFSWNKRCRPLTDNNDDLLNFTLKLSFTIYSIYYYYEK